MSDELKRLVNEVSQPSGQMSDYGLTAAQKQKDQEEQVVVRRLHSSLQEFCRGTLSDQQIKWMLHLQSFGKIRALQLQIHSADDALCIFPGLGYRQGRFAKHKVDYSQSYYTRVPILTKREYRQDGNFRQADHEQEMLEIAKNYIAGIVSTHRIPTYNRAYQIQREKQEFDDRNARGMFNLFR